MRYFLLVLCLVMSTQALAEEKSKTGVWILKVTMMPTHDGDEKRSYQVKIVDNEQKRLETLVCWAYFTIEKLGTKWVEVGSITCLLPDVTGVEITSIQPLNSMVDPLCDIAVAGLLTRNDKYIITLLPPCAQ